MICVIANLETAAGRRDDLLAIFRDLVPQVRAEKGCIEYFPTIDVAASFGTSVRQNVLTVVEKWESLAALEAHNRMPHMADFRKRAEPLGMRVSLQILQPV